MAFLRKTILWIVGLVGAALLAFALYQIVWVLNMQLSDPWYETAGINWLVSGGVCGAVWVVIMLIWPDSETQIDSSAASSENGNSQSDSTEFPWLVLGFLSMVMGGMILLFFLIWFWSSISIALKVTLSVLSVLMISAGIKLLIHFDARGMLKFWLAAHDWVWTKVSEGSVKVIADRDKLYRFFVCTTRRELGDHFNRLATIYPGLLEVVSESVVLKGPIKQYWRFKAFKKAWELSTNPALAIVRRRINGVLGIESRELTLRPVGHMEIDSDGISHPGILTSLPTADRVEMLLRVSFWYQVINPIAFVTVWEGAQQFLTRLQAALLETTSRLVYADLSDPTSPKITDRGDLQVNFKKMLADDVMGFGIMNDDELICHEWGCRISGEANPSADADIGPDVNGLWTKAPKGSVAHTIFHQLGIVITGFTLLDIDPVDKRMQERVNDVQLSELAKTTAANQADAAAVTTIKAAEAEAQKLRLVTRAQNELKITTAEAEAGAAKAKGEAIITTAEAEAKATMARAAAEAESLKLRAAAANSPGADILFTVQAAQSLGAHGNLIVMDPNGPGLAVMLSRLLQQGSVSSTVKPPVPTVQPKQSTTQSTAKPTTPQPEPPTEPRPTT